MSERFELVAPRLDAAIDELVASMRGSSTDPEVNEALVPDIELLAIHLAPLGGLEDPGALHEASTSVQLAWLVYLLGIRGVWRGPPGLDHPKAIGAVAVEDGPKYGAGALVIDITPSDGPPVTGAWLFPDEVVPTTPDSPERARRVIHEVVQEVLDAANQLVAQLR